MIDVTHHFVFIRQRTRNCTVLMNCKTGRQENTPVSHPKNTVHFSLRCNKRVNVIRIVFRYYFFPGSQTSSFSLPTFEMHTLRLEMVPDISRPIFVIFSITVLLRPFTSSSMMAQKIVLPSKIEQNRITLRNSLWGHARPFVSYSDTSHNSSAVILPLLLLLSIFFYQRVFNQYSNATSMILFIFQWNFI